MGELRSVIGNISRDIGVGVVEKEWELPRYAALPVAAELLFTGKAYFESAKEVAVRTQEGVHASCLFNATANLVFPESQPKAPRDGPFCVADYNRICQDLAREEGGAYRLVLRSSDDIPPGKYVLYHPIQGSVGHFFGAHVCDGGLAYLYDDSCGLMMIAEKRRVLDAIRRRGGHCIFELTKYPCETPIQTKEYGLSGAGFASVQEGGQTRTALERCALCNYKLCANSLVAIEVLTATGVVRATDTRLRCVNKSCRVLYANNFFWDTDGARRNTSRKRSDVGKVLLVTSKSGVCVEYLKLHYARTYRASVNPSSECSSLRQMIGESQGRDTPAIQQEEDEGNIARRLCLLD